MGGKVSVRLNRGHWSVELYKSRQLEKNQGAILIDRQNRYNEYLLSHGNYSQKFGRKGYENMNIAS